MYHNRGNYQIDFEEFMTFIASSLKVDASVTLTKTMMESIAEKLLMILGTRTAERLIPIVGAVIGGTANYLFIKRMALSVKKLHTEPIVILVDGS
jgi:site-specific recombinase XerD